MDVEQWWNKPERGKQKDPEEAFLSTNVPPLILRRLLWYSAGSPQGGLVD